MEGRQTRERSSTCTILHLACFPLPHALTTTGTTSKHHACPHPDLIAKVNVVRVGKVPAQGEEKLNAKH